MGQRHPDAGVGRRPALKDLAVKELKGLTDATEQAKLGDAWWDLGEKKNGLAKKNIQGHAASWYQQALPGLTGLVKEKVEKRLTVAAPPSDPCRCQGSTRYRFTILWVAEKGGWGSAGWTGVDPCETVG